MERLAGRITDTLLTIRGTARGLSLGLLANVILTSGVRRDILSHAMLQYYPHQIWAVKRRPLSEQVYQINAM